MADQAGKQGMSIKEDSFHSCDTRKQTHEHLGVPLFAGHIRAVAASFDSKIADVGNLLERQLGR
jgi:hypothetical protein